MRFAQERSRLVRPTIQSDLIPRPGPKFKLRHYRTPTVIVEETQDGEKTKRPPIVVTREDPPADKDEALRRWRKARKAFQEAEAAARKVLDGASRLAALPRQIAEADALISTLVPALDATNDRVNQLSSGRPVAEAELGTAKGRYESAQEAKGRLKAARPSFLSGLFNREGLKGWYADFAAASNRAEQAWDTFQSCQERHSQIVAEQAEELSTLEAMVARLETHRAQREEFVRRARALEAALGGTSIDQSHFLSGHKEQQLAAPWLAGQAALKRDDLFEAAINLHRAFVDAAARPIRHNLNLLMDSFGTRSFGSEDKDRLIPHLWSSLFLVVPVVSTTFASVGRMFSNIGTEDIGWLLIDEAGQALPQAAVGAIMRSRRAVVVGDPLQIEPVVVLPDTLTDAVCREFNVDETVYNAPTASAQTLADAATPYFASFETRIGSRDVGVPLLVHRRCADPMFSISNAIAYENLMVQAKATKRSPIAEALGPSRWINVEGSAQDKWCADEGHEVISLLRKIRDSEASPDLYIVTPFVVVQDRMRELVRTSGVLTGWVDDVARWPYDRIGTVHTVQGREAEAVIFLLGAPMAQQKGARNWAGARPNILNVAVSRAQETLYVVGNRSLWRQAGVFAELDKML